MTKFDLYDLFVEIISKRRTKCRICETILTELNIESKDHPSGVMTPHSDKPQWVYVHCTKCDQDWSLSKILTRSGAMGK